MLACSIMLKKLIAWLKACWQSKPAPRNFTMSAIDASGLSAFFETLAADIQKIAAELSAASATAEQVTALQGQLAAEQAAHAADKALLDQANADLAASQATVTDLEAKGKAQLEAIAALLPPAA